MQKNKRKELADSWLAFKKLSLLENFVQIENDFNDLYLVSSSTRADSQSCFLSCQLVFDEFNRIANSIVLLERNIPIREQTGYWDAIHNSVYPDI